MNKFTVARPEKDEYNEFYQGYVSQVKGDDIIAELEAQTDSFSKIFLQIPTDKATYAYAEGKWNVKELIGHLIDGERVFSYRLLRISRKDETPLSGFEENNYVANSNFNALTIAVLTDELTLLRKANILLIKSLREEDFNLRGVASGFEISVRALCYIMFGHIAHHIKILQERYLN